MRVEVVMAVEDEYFISSLWAVPVAKQIEPEGVSGDAVV